MRGAVFRLGRPQRKPRWEPAPGATGLLLAATTTTRLAALVVVGLFTFTAPRHGMPDSTVAAARIAAFTLAAVVVVWYSAAEYQAGGHARSHRWNVVLLPYGLGAVAATCGAASMTPGGAPLIALAWFAVLWAGARTSQAGGWSVAALAALGVWAAWLATGTGTGESALYQASIPFGCLLVGLNIRAQRIQARQAAALAEQSAALLAQAERLRQEQARTAALDERARIAREIHDVLAHSLSALSVHLQVVQAVLAETKDVPRAVRLLDQAYRMAADGLIETRQAVHALRGVTRPLPETLAELCADHQQRHGARVSVEVTGQPRPLPPDTALALLRTAQEALVNTAKHAPHRAVGIGLRYTDEDTSLVVTTHLDRDTDEDTDRTSESGPDGHGSRFVTVNGGYGLIGLRERLVLLDGTLTAGRHGEDWVVAAAVPR